MQKKSIRAIAVFFILAFGLRPACLAAGPPVVTLSVPAAMAARAFEKLLPLQLPSIKGLGGKIRLESIRQLKFKNHQAAFLTAVSGHNVRYDMGAIQVDVGTVHLSFHSVVTIRFDRTRSILFVKPHLTSRKVKSTVKGVGADLSQLVSLFNGVEYPIAIRPLRPFFADIAGSRILLKAKIVDIRIRGDKLFIDILPRFEKHARKT